jgi:hypothetical protein
MENSKSEFPTLSTGLGNPAKGGLISTFPPRRRRDKFTRKKTRKDEGKHQFQLTDPDHFKHPKNASVASLRKRSASPRNQRPESNRNH